VLDFDRARREGYEAFVRNRSIANAPIAKCAIGATLNFHAGALIRRRLLFEMRTSAEQSGLNFSLDESRGWLESDCAVRVRGADRAARQWLAHWSEYIRQAEHTQ
jgi:hypothetical protein